MNPSMPFIKTILKKQFLLAPTFLIGLLITFTSTNFVYTKPNELACPLPFVPDGQKCVLKSDAEIEQTVHLTEDMMYDGQGHKLIASQEGVLDNPATSAVNEYQASISEVAMLALDARRFKLENLTFEGFDFDLVIADAKNEPDMVQKSHISKCSFSGKYMGVLIVNADDILINHNIYDGFGVAVVILRDSDRNQIKNYEVTARANNLGLSPVFPGNRQFTFVGVGVGNPALDVRWGKGFPFNKSDVLNLVIDGMLYQYPLTDLNLNPTVVPEDNTFVSNKVIFTGNGGFTGFDMSDRSVRTTFLSNSITGPAAFGVFMSGVLGSTVTTPGTCSGDTSRLCGNNTDCNLPGFDQASLGSCVGAASTNQNSRTEDALVEGNIIKGPYVSEGVFLSQTLNPTVRNNLITGGGFAGIFVNSRALETSIITGNKITDNGMGSFNAINRGGISLFPTGGATHYGSKIYLNDLSGNFRAIGTTTSLTLPYIFPTDLFFDGTGNYYRVCSDSDGFRNSNEPDQNGNTDSPTPFITDTHPLSESPVFQDEDGFVHLNDPLPLTCAE